MSKFNDNDLDFDFEDDDYGLLDRDETDSRQSTIQNDIESNIRIAEERYNSSNDENDESPLTADLIDETGADSTDVISATKARDIVLYILTDRNPENLLTYLRKLGIQVSKVFSNIKEAGDQLMFEMNPCRLVVIDTGLGKFTGVASRKEVIDVLSMVDEDHSMTVFYTDKFLKNEVKDSVEVDYKQITWFKYKSTPEVVARLLLSKEKFILSDDIDEEVKSVDDILSTSGLPQSVKEPKHSIGGPAITIDQVLKNLESPDFEELKAYKVYY